MKDALTGEVFDFFGGIGDLEKGVIRHVNDDSFAEDPLRVLRAAQFAARFGFTVAEETLAICRKMDVSALPRERVFEELKKALLGAKKPSVFFEVLRAVGALDVWFPELQALIGIEQNPKYHAEGDVWVHTMMMLDVAAGYKQYSANPLGFMLSAVAHDFGKATCTHVVNGEIHAYEHEIAGIPLARDFIQRITGERALIKYLLNMVEHHMKPNVLASVGASVKSTNKLFDAAIDPEGLICLAIADGLGKISPRKYLSYNDFFRERIATYREYMSRPYVTGADLIAAGLKPDEAFSDYLAYAHKLRLAGIEKDSALRQTLAYARKNTNSRRK
jgi:tRNA nucleotidyltransferase (CCA-adding enzyme)